MNILVKNGKVIAVDKNLLKELQTDLSNISSIINTIELQLSSITKSPLTLKDLTFNVKQKDLLSIEDIYLFELEKIGSLSPEKELKIEPKIEITPEPKIEPKFEPKIQQEEPVEISLNKTIEEPIEILEPKISEPEEIKIPSFEIEPTIEKEETKKDFDVQNIELSEIAKPPFEEPKKEVNLKPEPQIEPKKPEEMEISISFEDEFSEIENMLNLTPKEAQKELEEELKTAAKELSIDYDTIYDLKEELFEMLKNEKKSLLKAIHDKNYDEIHKIAHKLKGAALNLRLSNLALILKKIDELSKNKKDIHKIEYLTKKFYDFLEKIDNIEKPKPKVPKEIKQLILKTIDEYLSTQNEKKFKKDLEYIQRLLNVKVETIEDLQNIIKD
jgi:HPt (histidine-containing phosphotransfer) domain-containing protein